MMFPDASRELTFENLRRRRQGPPNKLVIHWTAAEGSAQQVFRTLNKRGLSVDFIVDWDGKLYCCNEDLPNRLTSHAGPANTSSVGVEVVNYGTRPAAKQVPQHKVAQKYRPLTVQTLHGRKFYVGDFWPEQFNTLRRLCWGAEYYLGIPSVFPTKEGTNRIEDKVIDWRSHEGVLGHFHISPRKLDPGTKVLQDLRDSLATGGRKC